MKGRKAGGATEGVKEWMMDEKTRPEARTNARAIDSEATELKKGGRAKRKSGGIVHHEDGKPMAHAKHIGMVHGEGSKSHAGRKPRKSGGRAGSNGNPLSSASKGVEPAGHKTMMG
jgi:hypothetical protein